MHASWLQERAQRLELKIGCFACGSGVINAFSLEVVLILFASWCLIYCPHWIIFRYTLLLYGFVIHYYCMDLRLEPLKQNIMCANMSYIFSQSGCRISKWYQLSWLYALIDLTMNFLWLRVDRNKRKTLGFVFQWWLHTYGYRINIQIYFFLIR